MLVPTIARRRKFLFGTGNTSAISLTRYVPHGQDADILCLGCGDARNILYTAYLEDDVAPRKLDVTCCDYDERVIGRNIVLLTMILDGEDHVSSKALWDIYYHLYIEDDTAVVVLNHVQSLIDLMSSLESWRTGPFGDLLHICDEATLHDVNKVLGRIKKAAEERASSDARAEFAESLEVSRGFLRHGALVLSGLRSAAPLSIQSQDQMPNSHSHFWDHGTVRGTELSNKVPNPIFSGLVSDLELVHYMTNPLTGFHLATAFAALSNHSPLRPETDSGEEKMISAAQCQFFRWTDAFRKSSEKGQIKTRFVVSDALAFCHTIQHAGASGEMSANWYRRFQDGRILRLDEHNYGPGADAPMAFDVIDTSNLSDFVGLLNLVVSTAPLLKPLEWAVIHTEQLVYAINGDVAVLDDFACAHSSALSLLLGLTAFQYWTNAQLESSLDDYYLMKLRDPAEQNIKDLPTRLVWRRDDRLGKSNCGRPMLRVDPKALAATMFRVFQSMFTGIAPPSGPMKSSRTVAVQGNHHRGSFVALLKQVQSRVTTDWLALKTELVDLISEDDQRIVGISMMPDLFAQLHVSKLHTLDCLSDLASSTIDMDLIKDWPDVPPTVAVTVIVPRAALESAFSLTDIPEKQKSVSPTIIGYMKSRGGEFGPGGCAHLYPDCHLVFGRATARRDEDTGDAIVDVIPDELEWKGDSPLIASFLIPTEMVLLEPKRAEIGIEIPPSALTVDIFGPALGPNLLIFTTKLTDSSNVLFSRYLPGQKADAVICGGAKPLEEEKMDTKGEGPMTLTADIDSDGKVAAISARLSIASELGLKLLGDKVPIELHQEDPLVIDVVFQGPSEKHVCSLGYPIPVTAEGAKTRIARTSQYIEVMAPMAKPGLSSILADYIMPTVLTDEGLPIVLNAPHVNLDRLPILDLEKKQKMKWLTKLAGYQFSGREKAQREVADSRGLTKDVRVDFKESVFTMFMCSSGLQGTQTGLFTLYHPEKGGIHVIILVSAIRLEPNTSSVVLDAAVIPLTTRLLESRKLEDFLVLFQEMESAEISMSDEELALWKKSLPAMAERCRTWSHLPQCEYRESGATVPLSLGFGEPLLCSCGEGKIPQDFVAIPLWEEAVGSATRIAISPVFTSPLAEDKLGNGSGDAEGEGAATKCRNCGKWETKGTDGVALKSCGRCKVVKYCSSKCQKAHWKHHKQECGAVV